ncbi:MAG: glycosyltransferase [Actinomycetota bacterium]|nr:glycosyltransferase [Actinomycetota bacterium]
MDPAGRPVLLVGLPESGLLNPLLVLAGELARRGVPNLLFATDEPRRDEVEALGAASPVRFVSLGAVLPAMSAVTWDDETYRAVMQKSRIRGFQELLQRTFDPSLSVGKFRALERIVLAERPAVMVIDVMASFAVDVALKHGIPYVLSSPFLPSNGLVATTPFGRSVTPRGYPTPRSGLPYPMTARQQLANRLFRLRTVTMFARPAMSRRLARAGRIRAELGVPARAGRTMAAFDHAELVLCYSLAGLDYPFDLPAKIRPVGAMVPPLPQAPGHHEVTSWLDAHESVVYQAFGTITRLRRDEVANFVEVARRLQGRHAVLWKLPAEQQNLLPTDLPGNLRIENWLPSQLDVLAHPHVRVFFNHGGGNAFHEAVYFGKPQVVRPLWVDCHDQAVRAGSLGIGLPLDSPDVDVDDITDKLLRVLEDPAFTARSQRFAAQMREAGGRTAGADALLSLNLLATVR